MKKVFLLLLILVTFSAFSQNVGDMYERYLETKGAEQIEIVNEMAQLVYDIQCVDTLFHVDNNTKPELVAAIVNEIMAFYMSYVRNDLEKAVVFAIEAARLYEQCDAIADMDRNYSEASVYYVQMGDYENAIVLMLKCYELETQLNNHESLSSTLNNLGITYSRWGKSDIAIEYFRKAVEIERPLNRPLQYAGRLSSLAKETSLLGNHAEALELIKEALLYDEKLEGIQREDRIATHTIIMGDIYVSADSLQQAEKCYKHAVTIFDKLDRQQLLASSLLGLGRLQVMQKQFEDAKKTLKRCITISEKNNLLHTLTDANRYMYEAYKETEPETQALFHLEQYHRLVNQIFRETTQQQLSELQVKYETAEKELEIERQKTELNRRQTILYITLVGYFIFLLLFIMLVHILRLRNRRNRELAEINATRNKFFSIISHDLKNPAIAQNQALKLITAENTPMDAETKSLYLTELLKSSDYQVTLLNNLLDWARVQTGRITYTPLRFNLTETLHTEIALIQNMATAKNIRFNVQMPEEAIITGDRNILATVVRNLLTNAVKFTAAEGTVTLDISPSTGTGRRRRGRERRAGEKSFASTGEKFFAPTYTISISDTGGGMSPEQIQNIFRIDKHHSKVGTAGEKGSGLGLIVCQELLEKHGSKLRIESEVGKGSRFWFEI